MLFFQQLGDFGGAGGFTRTLQTDHHDHDRRRCHQIEFRRAAAKHFDQRIIDDLDNLLARRDRTQHRLANGKFGNIIDKAANDGQCNVCFEQRDAHFAHSCAHVFFVQRATATQAIEDASKPV